MSATAEAFGIIFALLVAGAVIWGFVAAYKEHKQSKRTAIMTASLPDNPLQTISHNLDRSKNPRDVAIRSWVNEFLKNSTPGARDLAGRELGKTLAMGVDQLAPNLRDAKSAALYYNGKFDQSQ